MERIALSRRAVKDLRRIGPGHELSRIREALETLAGDELPADVKALRGQSPWRRLRVGNYRILYRPLVEDESAGASYLVARVIHRSELDRAVGTLA